MKALVVVDYTYDFVEGKLPCGDPAIEIQSNIAELTETFVKQGDYVVMAMDVHEENDPYHPETSLFPPHNIRGTAGRELYGKLKPVAEQYQSSIYWMDKTRYSSFCGTDLDVRLRARGIQQLHIVGVCTDICVLHTAIDAYNLGYQIVIHQDGVASFNPEAHKWALEHMRNTLGATIIG